MKRPNAAHAVYPNVLGAMSHPIHTATAECKLKKYYDLFGR
jgi:hypothetical protein